MCIYIYIYIERERYITHTPSPLCVTHEIRPVLLIILCAHCDLS